MGEAIRCVTFCHLSVPKIRFCNNGDEVRRGWAQIRCGPRAGWRDGSERPCRETDEFSTHYTNMRHTSSESGVERALRAASTAKRDRALCLGLWCTARSRASEEAI